MTAKNSVLAIVVFDFKYAGISIFYSPLEVFMSWIEPFIMGFLFATSVICTIIDYINHESIGLWAVVLVIILWVTISYFALD